MQWRHSAQGQTSESESSGHFVRFPFEVAIQQTFPFWCLEWRIPWGARMSFYKDPNGVPHCHVLDTCAAAFLFLDGSAVCLLRARGTGIPSALGFCEGMGSRQRRWQQTLPGRNSEVLAPMFFLQNHSSQLSLIRLLPQHVGGSTFLCVAAKYSRCQG